jgi:hypothetical protein
MWANAHCATFIYKFHYIKLAGTHWMQHKQKHKRKPSRNCFENKAEGFSLFWNVFFRPSLWLDSCTCAYFYINPYFRHFTASHFFNLLSSCLCLYACVQWGSKAMQLFNWPRVCQSESFNLELGTISINSYLLWANCLV